MSVQDRYKMLRKRAANSDPKKIADKSVRSAEKAADVAESLGIGFDNLVRLGLCEWRHGIGNPPATLRAAYETAIRAAEILQPSALSVIFQMLVPQVLIQQALAIVRHSNESSVFYAYNSLS